MTSGYSLRPVYAVEVKEGMYLRQQGFEGIWRIANNVIHDSCHVVGIEWYDEKGYYDWFYDSDQFDQLLHTSLLY